jgi:tRNA(Ile)-lysidine synthase
MRMAAPTATPVLDRSYLSPGDRVCAAVSGGADSVAMLLLLHGANRLPRNALGVGLSAVHVHHGLRGAEADADLAFVQELCARLDVPLHLRHASVPGRLASRREEGEPEGTEQAARTLRYACFEELLASGAADSILTAHTLDDQAETVLMKFLRGAWTEGLSGIHPLLILPHGTNGAEEHRRGRIVRPLLTARHADLCGFLTAQGQPWREDTTNSDEAFTRNRVRHHLLPILREFNPALDQALANLAVLAREEEARWAAEMARSLPHLLLPGRPVRGGGRAVETASSKPQSVAIEMERLRALDPAMRRRVVRAAARKLGVRLDFDETARLLDLVRVSGGPNQSQTGTTTGRAGSSLHLGGGLRADRSARELRLTLARSGAFPMPIPSDPSRS